MRIDRFFGIAIVAVLAACGGGGSSTTAPTSPFAPDGTTAGRYAGGWSACYETTDRFNVDVETWSIRRRSDQEFAYSKTIESFINDTCRDAATDIHPRFVTGSDGVATWRGTQRVAGAPGTGMCDRFEMVSSTGNRTLNVLCLDGSSLTTGFLPQGARDEDGYPTSLNSHTLRRQ